MSNSVYIGVVGGDTIPTQAMLSIINIKRRPSDTAPNFIMATKGYDARQQHLNKWIDETTHDYMLLLDHDMIFEPDTLEALRSHGKPFVSGYYMRRRIRPMASVWFEPFSGVWPLMPFLDVPSRDQLHELGGSGWGCILMHRDVVTAVRPLLKGQPEIIEDSMYFWPHEEGETPRKLRGVHWPLVGSDVRFPFFAAEAGYPLMGDANVRPAHLISYALTPDDYELQPDATRAAFADQIRAEVLRARQEWAA